MRLVRSHPRPTVSLACAGAVLLAMAGTAAAARPTTYRASSFSEPARAGLAVAPPLAESRAVSRARVITDARWRALRASGGQLRFRTGSGGCRYTVTFRVRSRLTASRSPADELASRLRPAGAAYVLDSGTHGDRAFEVVREPTTAGVVRLRALLVDTLTRRKDIVPAGRAAFSELEVSAASLRGDECHSGTYRQVLGPALGDALASARLRLDFARAR